MGWRTWAGDEHWEAGNAAELECKNHRSARAHCRQSVLNCLLGVLCSTAIGHTHKSKMVFKSHSLSLPENSSLFLSASSERIGPEVAVDELSRVENFSRSSHSTDNDLSQRLLIRKLQNVAKFLACYMSSGCLDRSTADCVYFKGTLRCDYRLNRSIEYMR